MRGAAAAVLPPEAVQACQQVLAQGSQSFALAQRMLPRRLRLPAAAIYAFCRQADDAVDGGGSPEWGVAAVRARLDRLFAAPPEAEVALAPVDAALHAVVMGYALPRAPFDALVEGLAWDAAGRRYSTLGALQEYAARVASSVGVMMAHLMGVSGRDQLARACDLGLAMQLTNIARDVGEDARIGRLYLPLQWLVQGGLTDVEGWLARPVEHPAVASATQRLLSHAHLLYRRADDGIRGLPGDCRVGVYAARLIYAAIGDVVRRRRYQTIVGRAVVPGWRKSLAVACALGARFWRQRSQHLSSLESYAFLLAPPPTAPSSRAG